MSEDLLAKCEYRSICPLSRVQAERDSLKQQCGDLNVKCLRLEAEVKRQQAIIDEWAGLVAAPQPTSAGAITYVEGATYSTCQECARLREALEGLVSRLHAVHRNSKYRRVWAEAERHLGTYRGPFYDDELNAARAALSGGKA